MGVSWCEQLRCFFAVTGDMYMKYARSSIVRLILFSLVFVSLFGCSLQNSKKGSFFDTFKKDTEKKAPVYYDFKDVLIPGEFKYDKKASFVYKGAGILSGYLFFEGRVETNSLVKFFINNMAKDGWMQVSVFKSPNSMILFKKENRRCIIVVKSGAYNTFLNIWVAQTMSNAVSKENIIPGIEKPADLPDIPALPENEAVFPGDEAYENMDNIPMD